MSIKYLLQNMVCGAHDYGEVYRYGYPFYKEYIYSLEHINFSDNRPQIKKGARHDRNPLIFMVGGNGFEPSTSTV